MTKISAAPEIGGTYQTYAPGHGAIAFVHVDHKGNATNERVPLAAHLALTPKGWALWECPRGRIEAFRPVKRLAGFKLECWGNEYMYEPTEYAPNSSLAYEFFMRSRDGWGVLRNESMRASLLYFLRNESEIESATKEGVMTMCGERNDWLPSAKGTPSGMQI